MSVLPNSKIILENGQVQSVYEWVLWNGTPANTISIKRTPTGFSALISDPEHGGGVSIGTKLEDVLSRLHPNTRKKYLQMFSRRNLTRESATRRFPRYEIKLK